MQQNEFNMLTPEWCSCRIRLNLLTHWGRVKHIFVDNLTIIGSDNRWSTDRRQAIIWTNAGISLETNLSDILIANVGQNVLTSPLNVL